MVCVHVTKCREEGVLICERTCLTKWLKSDLSGDVVALRRAVLVSLLQKLNSLLAACVLGDGLGTFTDGVLGQFTGQQKPDSGLDLSAGDG